VITLFIIVITVFVSITAFRNRQLMNQLIFYPPAVRQGQGYRLFTYGFLHADYMHLLFNMFTFYLFGSEIERVWQAILGKEVGSIAFIVLYASAIVISILPTYRHERDNDHYFGLGASGAVSAVVFAYVLINPMSYMGIMFIPIWFPAFLFGFMFIAVSVYLDKKQAGGINHLAHVAGGIYGILFTVIVFLAFDDINLLSSFIDQIHIRSIGDLIRFGY